LFVRREFASNDTCFDDRVLGHTPNQISPGKRQRRAPRVEPALGRKNKSIPEQPLRTAFSASYNILTYF